MGRETCEGGVGAYEVRRGQRVMVLSDAPIVLSITLTVSPPSRVTRSTTVVSTFGTSR